MTSYRTSLDVMIEMPLVDDPRRRYEHSDEGTGPRCLWLAVLGLAMSDALGITGRDGGGDCRDEARRWWRYSSAVDTICYLCGLDPAWVRERALARIRAEETELEQTCEAARARRRLDCSETALRRKNREQYQRHKNRILAERREMYASRMEARFPGWTARRNASNPKTLPKS